MVYTRSSFLKYLTSKGCDIIPLGDSNVIRIENGTQHAYITTNRHDRITYEEIHIVYNKLLLVDLPGAKDLEEA
jgi:hypothetical protein